MDEIFLALAVMVVSLAVVSSVWADSAKQKMHAELTLALAATLSTLVLYTCLMTYMLRSLFVGQGRLGNVIRACVAVPAVLIATCGTFPVINMFFPPHNLALLYVVGNRMQPNFNDGDVMVTVSAFDSLGLQAGCLSSQLKNKISKCHPDHSTRQADANHPV